MFRAFGSNKGRNGLFRLGLVVFTLIFCATIFFSGSLFGQETTSTESGDNSSGMSLEWVYWGLVLAASFAALIQARMFYTGMKEADEGTDRMQEIAGFVREGATAYLKQQYKVVSIFMVIVALLLLWAGIAGVQERWVWLAFLTGGFWSGLAGFIGMKTATQASNRTAAGAQTSLNDGLQVAFRSGAVMGLTVVGLGMLDMSFWYLVLSFVYGDLETGMIINTMLCSLMGASSQALFARVGGGIFTKACRRWSGFGRERSKRTSRKMTRVTLRPSPTMWVTMLVTLPAWARIFTKVIAVQSWQPRLWELLPLHRMQTSE